MRLDKFQTWRMKLRDLSMRLRCSAQVERIVRFQNASKLTPLGRFATFPKLPAGDHWFRATAQRTTRFDASFGGDRASTPYR